MMRHSASSRFLLSLSPPALLFLLAQALTVGTALRISSLISPPICCAYPAMKVLDDKNFESYGKSYPVAQQDIPEEGSQPILRPVPDPGPGYFSACENCDPPTPWNFDSREAPPGPEDPQAGDEQPYPVLSRGAQVRAMGEPPQPEIPVFDVGAMHN